MNRLATDDHLHLSQRDDPQGQRKGLQIVASEWRNPRC